MTVCGRSLVHRQHSVGSRQVGPEAGDTFLKCHARVLNALSSQVDVIATTSPNRSLAEVSDPIDIFTLLIAHATIMLLFKVRESLPTDSEGWHDLFAEHKQQLVVATGGIRSLIQALEHLNLFHVSPEAVWFCFLANLVTNATAGAGFHPDASFPPHSFSPMRGFFRLSYELERNI